MPGMRLERQVEFDLFSMRFFCRDCWHDEGASALVSASINRYECERYYPMMFTTGHTPAGIACSWQAVTGHGRVLRICSVKGYSNGPQLLNEKMRYNPWLI